MPNSDESIRDWHVGHRSEVVDPGSMEILHDTASLTVIYIAIIEPIALLLCGIIRSKDSIHSRRCSTTHEAASGKPRPSLRPVENYVKSLLYNDLVIDASQAVASSIIVERVG